MTVAAWVAQTPHASPRMRTCPAPGSDIWRSTTRSLPGSYTSTALYVSLPICISLLLTSVIICVSLLPELRVRTCGWCELLLSVSFSQPFQRPAPCNHFVCHRMDSFVVLFVWLKGRELLEVSPHRSRHL